MIRKQFNWKDPTTGIKYRDIFSAQHFVNLLANVIETEEQAESFLEKYKEACSDAEYNIGYFIRLISDPDIREDALELWMVDIQLSPRQALNREYSFSEQIRSK